MFKYSFIILKHRLIIDVWLKFKYQSDVQMMHVLLLIFCAYKI